MVDVGAGISLVGDVYGAYLFSDPTGDQSTISGGKLEIASTAMKKLWIYITHVAVIKIVALVLLLGYSAGADETPNQKRKRLGLPGDRTQAAVNPEWEDHQVVFQRLSKKAAEGDSTAQYELSKWYGRNGKSPDGPNKAHFWLQKAARGGNQLAIVNLCDPMPSVEKIASSSRTRIDEAIYWCKKLGCKECLQTADYLEQYLGNR